MEDEQNILEIQLILGKQVLEEVVLPLNINDREFTIVKEEDL
ncbi:hypothetical protein [Streptococcus pneumoniae]|nr:hypothetical protein [Streptococcus pneumoniae]SND40267.1 Uncharacterised protein [Streptococcus pneumoniae]SNG09368.1 Uncharacterised protein [Streptococcus pneumoniae]SNG87297.1 Uncharacterised protein [Streptococcus pneumoniae]VIQ44168.1 Uncharacterised protein [Streptococcus pneumoniae]VKX62856.1 Uncharacterised protein [Streptococcus pneumoniae]